VERASLEDREAVFWSYSWSKADGLMKRMRKAVGGVLPGYERSPAGDQRNEGMPFSLGGKSDLK
jgi:hypothetical protein